MTVVEKREIISLRESWSSSRVVSGKYVKSGCAYGWEEIGNPFSSRFTFSISNKYYHTLCIYIGCEDECLCLWLSSLVFEQSLEMFLCFYNLLYLYDL
jgi:hypothetical protein